MVLSDTLTVLHGAPVLPGRHLVPRRVPDLLAPDDILDIVGGGVVHDPFGDVISRQSRLLQIPTSSACTSPKEGKQSQTYTAAIRNHKVNRLAAAVL